MIPEHIAIIAKALYAINYGTSQRGVDFSDASPEIQKKCIHNAYAIQGDLETWGFKITR